MTELFDPYYVWLGIPPEEQPPHHYRLLGLRAFESNADVISNAADQRRTHLRTFQAGKRGLLSQKLLNEVSAASVCLLDPAKKQKYDDELRQRLGPSTGTSGIGLPVSPMPPMPGAERPLKVARAIEDQPLTPIEVANPVAVTAAPKTVTSKAASQKSGPSPLLLLLVGGGATALLVATLVGVVIWRLVGSGEQLAVNPPRPVPPKPIPVEPIDDPRPPVPNPNPIPNPNPNPPQPAPPTPPIPPQPGVPVVTPGSPGVPAEGRQVWLANDPKKWVIRQIGNTWVEFRDDQELWLDRHGGGPNMVSLVDPVTRRVIMLHDDQLQFVHPLQAPAIVTPGRWIAEADLPGFARRGKSAQRPSTLVFRDSGWDALVLDGQSSVEVPMPAELTAPGADFTIELWLRLEPDCAAIQILDSPALGLASDPQRLLPGRPGLPMQLRAGAIVATFHPAIEGRKWHHLAIVRDGLSIRLFCDGRTVAGVPADRSLALAGPSLRVGSAVPPRLPGMRGLVRDLRISSGSRYRGSFTPQLRLAKDDQTLVLPRFNGDKRTTIEDLSGRGHTANRGTAEWLPLTEDGLVMAELPTTHVDLRRTFSVSRNTLRGDSWRNANVAELKNASGLGQVLLPYEPPGEYDLEMEVQRTGGGGGALVGLVVGSHEEQRQIAVAVGGYPKDGRARIGVLPADFSELDKALVPCGFQIRADQPQRIKLEVRRPLPDSYGLKIYLDGGQVYETQQPLATAGLPAELAMPHRASLFFGSQDAALRYTEMKLTPVVAGRTSPDYLARAIPFLPVSSSRPGFPPIGPVVSNPNPPIPTPAAPRVKKPVPATEDLSAKMKEARDLYQEEFKKATKPEQKAALARDIQRAGEGTTSDQTARYVLLDLARKVFIQAGEVGPALRAARDLEAEYEIPPAEMVSGTCEGLNDASLDFANRAELAKAAMDQADEQIESGEYERADVLATLAVQSANKQKEADLKKQMVQRRVLVSRIVKEHAAVKSQLETLATSADDPAANLAAGKFYCLTLEDWARGVPLLIKSKDGVFSAAAELDEKAKAGAANDQLAAAEAWLELADGTKVPDKDDKLALQRRGKQLIQSAIGSLSGLDKLKAEKRMEKLRDLPPGRTFRSVSSRPAQPDPPETATTAPTPFTPTPRSSRPPILVGGQKMLPPGKGEFDAVHLIPGATSGGGPDLVNGWELKPKADLEVTHLGLYDTRMDGLVMAHEVAIWDVEDRAVPLVQATLPAGREAPLAAMFRMVAVKPVILKADRTYAVVAHYANADDSSVSLLNPQGLTLEFAQHVEATGRRYAISHKTMAFPDRSNSDTRHATIGPTFRYKLATP